MVLPTISSPYCVKLYSILSETRNFAMGSVRTGCACGCRRGRVFQQQNTAISLTAWGGSHSTAFLSSGQELDLGHEVGADRLCLRLPTVVMHVIKDGSPLAHWADPSGILLDADSEIVVVVSPPPQSPCSKAQSK